MDVNLLEKKKKQEAEEKRGCYQMFISCFFFCKNF